MGLKLAVSEPKRKVHPKATVSRILEDTKTATRGQNIVIGRSYRFPEIEGLGFAWLDMDT